MANGESLLKILSPRNPNVYSRACRKGQGLGSHKRPRLEKGATTTNLIGANLFAFCTLPQGSNEYLKSLDWVSLGPCMIV